MKVELNGEMVELPDGATVASAIEASGAASEQRGVAVAVHLDRARDRLLLPGGALLGGGQPWHLRVRREPRLSRRPLLALLRRWQAHRVG